MIIVAFGFSNRGFLSRNHWRQLWSLYHDTLHTVPPTTKFYENVHTMLRVCARKVWFYSALIVMILRPIFSLKKISRISCSFLCFHPQIIYMFAGSFGTAVHANAKTTARELTQTSVIYGDKTLAKRVWDIMSGLFMISLMVVNSTEGKGFLLLRTKTQDVVLP